MRRVTLLAAFAAFLIACGGHHDASVVDGPPGVDHADASVADASVVDGPPDVDHADASVDAMTLPGSHPRLVVAGADGVHIWDHADELAAVRAPDATLGGVTGALGLAVGADTLYVTSSNKATALVRFAGASTLADGAKPTGTIDATALGETLDKRHTPLLFDGGDLWINTATGIRRVANAATATASTAHFTHPWHQIESMVVDAGRVIGGQTSGAGILVWNHAASSTGEVTSDWTLSPQVAVHAVVAGDRLYGSSYAPPDVSIWNAISTVTTAHAPDRVLHGVCGAGNGAELRYVTVTADDTLVVVHNELASGAASQHEKVCLFRHASTLVDGAKPDAVAENDAMGSTGSNSDKAVLAGTRLFVMSHDGVAIFDDALGTPAFVALLPITGPTDLLVL
jgi:hypothetical protein